MKASERINKDENLLVLNVILRGNNQTFFFFTLFIYVLDEKFIQSS